MFFGFHLIKVKYILFQPECYAPCCNAASGGVKLEGHYKFINKKLEYRKPFQFVNPYSFDREFAEDALYSRMKNEFVKSNKEYCDPISLFNDGSPESYDYFTEPPLNALVYEDEFSLNDARDALKLIYGFFYLRIQFSMISYFLREICVFFAFNG